MCVCTRVCWEWGVHWSQSLTEPNPPPQAVTTLTQMQKNPSILYSLWFRSNDMQNGRTVYAAPTTSGHFCTQCNFSTMAKIKKIDITNCW